MNYILVKPPLLGLCGLQNIRILRWSQTSRGSRNIYALLVKIKLLPYSQEKDHGRKFNFLGVFHNFLGRLLSLGWRHLNEYVFSL